MLFVVFLQDAENQIIELKEQVRNHYFHFSYLIKSHGLCNKTNTTLYQYLGESIVPYFPYNHVVFVYYYLLYLKINTSEFRLILLDHIT